MKLLKVSIWLSAAVICDFIAGIINQKIYATYTGKAGIVLAGNVSNFLNLLILIGSGGALSGITKIIASSSNPGKLWKQIVNLLLFTSIITSVFSLLLLPAVKDVIIPPDVKVHTAVLITLILTLPLTILMMGFLHMLMGIRKIRTYVTLKMMLQIFNVLLTFMLVSILSFNGLVLSFYLPTLLLFLMSMYMLGDYFHLAGVKPEITNKQVIAELLKFSAATGVSSSLLYLSQLFIRNYIYSSLSLESASTWQVLITISRTWTALFSILITAYFFPLASSMGEVRTAKRFLLKFSLYILIMSVVAAAVIYLLRKHIVLVVYNENFLTAIHYFSYQLIADILKISSLIFAYFVLSRGWVKTYIISELLHYSTLIPGMLILTSFLTLKGVLIAQIVAYVAYLLYLLISAFRK